MRKKRHKGDGNLCAYTTCCPPNAPEVRKFKDFNASQLYNGDIEAASQTFIKYQDE